MIYSMKVNNEAWEKLKQEIQYHIEQDHNLTDVTINYQLEYQNEEQEIICNYQ
jgi:hypothetical protein